MVPSIAHAILGGRFLRVRRRVLRVLLSSSVLCSPFVLNAKEKADDIAAPEFSVAGGVYTNDLKVAIKAIAGVVRFSLDGSEPGPESPAYNEPLQITNCAIVRAKAWTANGRPSRTVTQSYTLLAEDLLGFSSNLPLVIVKSCEGEIAPAEKSLGAMRIITNSAVRADRRILEDSICASQRRLTDLSPKLDRKASMGGRRARDGGRLETHTTLCLAQALRTRPTCLASRLLMRDW